jgi:signal transduction histidine kinase
MPPALNENRKKGQLQWDFMSRGSRHAAAALGFFAVLYSLLVFMGLVLIENVEGITIMWPAAGLLFIALWLSPRRNWIWILLIQVVIEIAAGAMHSAHFSIGRHLMYALANSIDGMVSALIALRLTTNTKIPRLQNVLIFMGSVAIGAAASSVLGAFASTRTLGGADYWREWQLWWAGSWLGSLCVAPILMGWAVRFRAREYSAHVVSPIEMMLISFGMLIMTIWVFSAPPGGVTTIFDMPFALLAFVVLAAFRMPPRWSTGLAAAAALLVAYFASRGFGPFAGDPNPFVRVGAAQLYLVTLVVINFLLTIALLERRNAYQLLRTSDERYRNFIENSSEAVWRIELAPPMDPNLPVSEQIAWIRAHAYIAESNKTYKHLKRQLGISEADAHVWRADAPWSETLMAHLGAASQRGYVLDGLQFTMPVASQPHTFIVGFRGFMEQGRLVRIWGVARDVTELVELNERLLQQQDRLKLYARELVGAEEKARRATAVDLHDGIGQQLVGLAMTLDALAVRVPPEVRPMLGEATSTVREVQAIAQRLIADLSPPWLYELGLEPALRWLSTYVRNKDNLQVDLDVAAQDAGIPLDLRVLVFKVIRELLRNVAKHSGVQSASVSVSLSDGELHVVVEDRGVGFEWQLSLFEPREQGFGLWSVADRVREAAGEMTVDTGPGRGCRVSLVFPLADASQAMRSARSATN